MQINLLFHGKRFREDFVTILENQNFFIKFSKPGAVLLNFFFDLDTSIDKRYYSPFFISLSNFFSFIIFLNHFLLIQKI